MNNNKLAHIRSAKAKIRLSKVMINKCKKDDDRQVFRLAIEARTEGERQLAQLMGVAGEGLENAKK